MKQHTTYKDSGIEWIGEIPEHWEVRRLGTWFSERNEKISANDFEPLSVTKNGIVPQLEHAAKSKDADNRKLVLKGDFVINSRSDRKGSSGLSKLDGSVSLINIVLKPNNIDKLYSHYLFKSYSFIEEFYRNGRGIVADLWSTRYELMKLINIPYPPLSEQAAIAEFLDEKTEKIDEAIRIKEREIELLKERRQILIQEVVTGKKVWHPDKEAWLPPTKTKDSGIEWIGEIPEEWEVRRLKHITTKIGSGITPRGGGLTYLDEGGVPLLRSQNILFGKIDLNEVARISPRTHESMKNSQVEKGDVLLNITGGSIGRCHYVEIDDPLNVNQHVCIIRPKGIKTEFLNFILSSKVGQNQIWYFQQGGGREGLNFQSIKNFFIPFPPKRHQIIIIEKTKTINSKISQLITLKEEEIEKLKEYKTVLIDAAVTGKVKVGENACPSA